MKFIVNEELYTFQQNGLTSKLTAFLRMMIAVWKHDKRHETDREMLMRVGSKFAVLFSIILMYDPLVDLLLSFFNSVFEFVHLFLEVIEDLCVMMFSYALQTSHRQSEIILVYSQLIVAIILFSRFIRRAPKLIDRCKRQFQVVCSGYIRQESTCWRVQPFVRKLKLIGIYTFGFSCLLFGFAF